MFKKSILVISILFISFHSLSAEDTISQWTYQYMKKINDYISEENWAEAKRELESFENKYFKNERSYERALGKLLICLSWNLFCLQQFVLFVHLTSSQDDRGQWLNRCMRGRHRHKVWGRFIR